MSAGTPLENGRAECVSRNLLPISLFHASAVQIFAQGGPSSRVKFKKERIRSMASKWLTKASWKMKSSVLNLAQENHSSNGNSHNGADASALPAMMFAESASKKPAFEMELLPIEEIYRAAGIVSPQKGYSVHKVIEMLHSKHMRGLTGELKRAAVLMALDAAGVSPEQVQMDAKARQEALDRYEADQLKHAEAEWARRAEETTQIQAELERVKSYYMARIGRNLEGIAREKVALETWVEKKKREAEGTAEVLKLLMKPAPSKSNGANGAHLSKAAAASAGGVAHEVARVRPV
jgi:hypothetical protein